MDLGPEAQTSLLSAARERMAEARRLLGAASADAIDRCIPHVSFAIGNFALIERRLRNGATVSQRFNEELRVFSKELRVVAALLRNASAFHAGLVRVEAAVEGRYGPQVVPRQPAPAARISVQG